MIFEKSNNILINTNPSYQTTLFLEVTLNFNRNLFRIRKALRRNVLFIIIFL